MSTEHVRNDSFGRKVRLDRLYRHARGRLMIVPLDHSITDGPIPAGRGGVSDLVTTLAASGVDAVVLHKGSLRYLDHVAFKATSLMVHLSASTVHAPDPNAKYLVAEVDEAVRLGADAVSVHVNLGSPGEMRQLADFAAVAGQCDRWSVPLLAMIYPRGPKITNPRDAELVAHAVTLAADLGADVVKTVCAAKHDEMADIVCASTIPVVVAGGPKLDGTDQVVSYVDTLMKTGAAGVAMGRNVFEAKDPAAVARRLADLVHHHPGNPVTEVTRIAV